MFKNRFVVLVTLFLLALQGCPPPEPIRGHRCATDDQIRENCGLCASARVCAWCGSEDPTVRGCYDRSQPFDCPGVVTTTLEGCEQLPAGQDGLVEDSDAKGFEQLPPGQDELTGAAR